jgi:hypothetical protein
VKWNLNMVLICISLMAKDVEYFCMYLSYICTSLKVSVDFYFPFIDWIICFFIV